jgi:hypothetical protein
MGGALAPNSLQPTGFFLFLRALWPKAARSLRYLANNSIFFNIFYRKPLA